MWEQSYDSCQTWSGISEERVRRLAKDYYHDVDLFIQTMKDSPGRVMKVTRYSQVRWIKDADNEK